MTKEEIIDMAERAIKNVNGHYNVENLYNLWLEKCPEYAGEFIAKEKQKRLLQPKILQMRLEGLIYKVIAEKLNIPLHYANKIGAPLHHAYVSICKENTRKIDEVAGDTRSKEIKEDFAYMNDKRTIEREMWALLPIYNELKVMVEHKDD